VLITSLGFPFHAEMERVMSIDEIKLFRCESIEGVIDYVKSSKIDEKARHQILLFVDELRMKGFSPFRIMAYAFTLVELADIVKKDFAELTAVDFRYYVSYLLNKKHNKHSTIREKMMRIRVFMRWLLDLPPRTTPEPMRWFFTINPKSTKGERKLEILEKIISYEEYVKLLQAASNPRDKALLQFMYESGARILEILKVRIKDLHLDENYAVVGGGKRLVPLANKEFIEEWLRIHPLKSEPEAYLFCNLRAPKKPLSYPAVRKLLRRISRKAGLSRRITAHMFRHSRATLLAKLEVSPYTMNQVMGWSTSTRMWQVYLHITQKDAIQEVLKKYDEHVAKLKL